jgi:hypothetical protein
MALDKTTIKVSSIKTKKTNKGGKNEIEIEKQSFLTIYSTNNKQETTQLKPDTTIQDVFR